ncbi:high affinity cAMP-specific and IBMX-insensitive 3',5'-cyclic phosphodiesterase 8 [Schistosoma bovis]|uniref:Phosphodiesterase n=1 Tax=Schistosoma bovis TaxID=6184 RepID=A0A430Q8L8_SCHBO|nr:high affinity cAMP-specific and IBMX-insensitive 3',5'-cyclic phosphodiesterase 8 [Schistosoma bovis]
MNMNYRQEYTHKHVIPLISQSNLWFPDISKPQRSSLSTLNNNNNYHYYQTYDFNKKPHNQYFNSSLITTQQQSIRSKYKLDLFNNISKRSLIQINNKQTIQSIKIRKHLYNNNHNNNTVDLNEQYTYYQLSIIDMVVLDIRKLKPNRSFSMSGTKSSQSSEINISNNNISSSLSNWCKQLRSYSPTKDSVICIFEATTVDDFCEELKNFANNEWKLLNQLRNFICTNNITTNTTTTTTTTTTSTSSSSSSITTTTFTTNSNNNNTVTTKAINIFTTPNSNENIVESENIQSNTELNEIFTKDECRFQMKSETRQPTIKESVDNEIASTDELKANVIDSVTVLHEQGKKFREFISVRKTRNSDTNNIVSLSALLHSRCPDFSSPMCKVIGILNSARVRSPLPVAKDLQKAINLICSSNVFVDQIMKPLSRTNDPITADLIEGLITGSNLAREPENLLKLRSLAKSLKGMKILDSFNALSVLRVPSQILVGWLTVIEEHYHVDNPYHNATHAGDVLQASAYFLQHSLIRSICTNIDEVATLLAAIVHDVDHPGKTNPFLVNSNDPLAILYNDIAVLESHHAAVSFELTLRSPDINIFQNLTRYIVDMVLSTEMVRHFDIVTKFVNTLSKPMLAKNRHHDRSSVGSMSSMESCSMGMTISHSTSPSPGQERISSTLENLSTAENRTLIKRLIIKCSDVNNPTRPLSI